MVCLFFNTKQVRVRREARLPEWVKIYRDAPLQEWMGFVAAQPFEDDWGWMDNIELKKTNKIKSRGMK
jgi:hypothetical protein